MEKYFAVINTIIAIALSYIALGEQLSKFNRWIRNKATHYYDAKIIALLILQWFEVIDDNDVVLDKDAAKKLDKIEREISFQFGRDGLDKKMIFKSSRRFIVKYLKLVGLRKSAHTFDQYYKYAHIKNVNLELSLSLISSSHHNRYNKLYFPLSFYWMIIKGNYYQWKDQYLKDWKDISEDKKIIYADIEMPMKVLRLYYKL